MSDGLPLYHQFYDRLTGAPWQAQPSPDGRDYVVIGGHACGCMALGEPMVAALPEYDAKVIAAAPEALTLLLQFARHVAADPADEKGQGLVDRAREMFAELMA